MICFVVRRMLPLHAGGDLGQRLGDWTQRHLQRCPGCAAEYRALADARARLRELAGREAPQPTTDLAGRAARAAAPAGRFAWPVELWAAAAAVAVVAGVGLLRGPAPPDTPLLAAADPPPAAAGDNYIEQADDLSRAEIDYLLRRLDRREDLSDAELERKYPTVESVNFPSGTLVSLSLRESNTKVVWIMPTKGGQI